MPNEPHDPAAVRRLPTLYREMTLDRAALATRAEGDERVPMSLSSEYAVERGGFFSEPYLEVLDHSTDAVDLSRAEGGLPLLLDHDPTKQIGVVEDVTLGTDRVLRGRARFSRNPLAQEVKRDVEDGIKSRTSIGYAVRELTQETRGSKESGPATMRATRWQLFENSIVSIPADPTVGVNRASDEAAHPVIVHTLDPIQTGPQARSITVSEQNTAPAGAAPTVVVTRDVNDERAREISALASQHGMTDKLPKWIAEGTSVEDVRGEMIASLQKRLADGPVQKPRVELTEREEKAYSFARALLQQDEGTKGFEREVSEEIARKLPAGYKPQGGFFIPTNIGQRAGLDSATSTKGPELKFTQPGSFIEQLRNKSRVIQAGATSLAGLDGPVSFPKQNGAGTASWVGENGGSDVAESNLLLTTVSLTAKTLQSTTSFSRQLLRQAVVDVEALVRADIAAVHALAVDAAALYGTGSSNQPTGVFAASGVNVIALGTNGAVPTYANMLAMAEQVEIANADVGAMSLITTPGVKATLKNTARLSNTIGEAIWTDANQVAGMAAYSSNQAQSTLTKGSASGICHAIYAGVWSQLLIAEFGAMEVITDPYRLKKQGMIEVTSFQMIDIAVRYAGAFAVIKDALVTAGF